MRSWRSSLTPSRVFCHLSHRADVEGRTDGLLSDSELVTGSHLDLDTERKGIVSRLLAVGTGLVRAEDRDTGRLLNSGDTGDDGLVVCELLSANGEGDGNTMGMATGIPPIKRTRMLLRPWQ